MGDGAVNVNAVTFFQDHHLITDDSLQLTLQDDAAFLAFMIKKIGYFGALGKTDRDKFYFSSKIRRQQLIFGLAARKNKFFAITAADNRHIFPIAGVFAPI